MSLQEGHGVNPRSLSLVLALCAAAGCKQQDTQQAPKASKPSEPSSRPSKPPDPFHLGAVATTAQPGDFVLCPPREWIDKALGRDKPGEQTFIFFGAHMVAPGPAQSRVKSLPGKEMMVPNSLIVPIRKGQTAAPGDIVLTAWQSGSGMERAIVVPGGTPERPQVRYLDIALDNPSGAGQQVDTCKPDTFHKLSGPWQPGTSVAAKQSFGYRHFKIIHVKGDRVLGLGFSGKLALLAKDDCTPVPVKPEVAVDGTVWVPHLGAYTAGEVKKVDAAIGRVFVEIEFAGKQTEVAAPIVDVLTENPAGTGD